MAKMSAKGKKVKGENYVAADEEFQKKEAKKSIKKMSTAGLAKEMKESQKEQGYSKKPRVKAQKKMSKLVGGQKKAY